MKMMSEDDTKTMSKTISAHTVQIFSAKSPDSRDSGDFAYCTTADLVSVASPGGRSMLPSPRRTLVIQNETHVTCVT